MESEVNIMKINIENIMYIHGVNTYSNMFSQ